MSWQHPSSPIVRARTRPARARRRPRMLPAVLLLVAGVIVATACTDSSPPSLRRSAAALDIDPTLPGPLAPICPEPGDAPSPPFPPDLPPSATTAAGAIAGSFSVSTTGEA